MLYEASWKTNTLKRNLLEVAKILLANNIQIGYTYANVIF